MEELNIMEQLKMEKLNSIEMLLNELTQVKKVTKDKIESIHEWLVNHFSLLPESVKEISNNVEEDPYFSIGTQSDVYYGYEGVIISNKYRLLISHSQWTTPLLFKVSEFGYCDCRYKCTSISYQTDLVEFLYCLPNEIKEEIQKVQAIQSNISSIC